MTVSTLCCARNVRKKAKLTVLIVLNVEGEVPHSTILPGEKRQKATPEELGRASSSQNKSRQCNGCMKKEADVNFKRCSCCKLVFYCSQTCQKRHWSGHQQLCKAIQKELSQHWNNPKGLGDDAKRFL